MRVGRLPPVSLARNWRQGVDVGEWENEPLTCFAYGKNWRQTVDRFKSVECNSPVRLSSTGNEFALRQTRAGCKTSIFHTINRGSLDHSSAPRLGESP